MGREERSENVRGTALQTPRLVEREGQEVIQVLELEVPLQLIVKQAVLHGGPWGCRDPPSAHGRYSCQSMSGGLKGRCESMRSPC